MPSGWSSAFGTPRDVLDGSAVLPCLGDGSPVLEARIGATAGAFSLRTIPESARRETVIEELSRYQDAIGVDECPLRIHLPGPDPARTDQSIRRFAEEVMPRFQ